MIMAKKEETKIVLERSYNVPLRRWWLMAPKTRRAKKAVTALKAFMAKHMKASAPDMVKIGKYANQEIWKRGIRSPPHHIKVIAKKDDKGIILVEFAGAPAEEKKDLKKKSKQEPVKKDIPIKEVKPTEPQTEIVKEAEFTEKKEEKPIKPKG